MIIKFKNYKLINENPDTIYYNNNRYYVEDNDAQPFICDMNEDHTKVIQVFVREAGRYHGSLGEDESNNLAYKGRLWSNSKIISFWVYPKPDVFKQIIKKLEEKTGFKIFNNDWKVDILKNEKGDIKMDIDGDDSKYYSDSRDYQEPDMIPVEEYAGSEDVPEEEIATHLLSWKEKEKLKKEKGVKGFGSDKTAWDRPYNIKYRQALHQEKNILNFNSYLIKETPDYLNVSGIPGDYHYYHNEDAKPFFVDMGHNSTDHISVKKLYIGDFKDMHSNMSYKKDEVDRAYAGRIWLDLKVISFWVYPSVDIFNQIIRLFEKQLNIKMFNNNWYVEIIKKDNKILRHEFDEEGVEDYFFGNRNGSSQTEEVIPIEEYSGSEDFPEELRIQHMLSWKEKDRLKKEKGVKGFGSDKTAWDSPHNIKYRQTIHQENKKNDDN